MLWRAHTLSSRVSLESRYGACAVAEPARALMHMPSIVRDILMLFASSARSPAPSTRAGCTLPSKLCVSCASSEQPYTTSCRLQG